MEKILCLPHQMAFISIDGSDVPISAVFWDSNGADVPIDGLNVFTETIGGSDAAQSLFFLVSQAVGDLPGDIVGGVLRVLENSPGDGLAISNSGVGLNEAHLRGFAIAAYVASETPITSPIRVAPGESIVFGRERAITPAGGVGGSGGAAGSVAAGNHLHDYCLRSLTSDSTVVVEILDANWKTVAAGTITVAAASAKSAEVLITAGLGQFLSTYKKMIIISISGGLTFWNRAGTGDANTNDGVGTPAPTSTNALPLLPGMVLG